MFSFFQNIFNYTRGFLSILQTDLPRYSFLIKQIDIVYFKNELKAEVIYMPIGAFRPFKNYISDLNNPTVLDKFKPDHARIIIGISTLESCLDLSNNEQNKIYLNFIKSCVLMIKSEEKL
jgi:hypothetical protein